MFKNTQRIAFWLIAVLSLIGSGETGRPQNLPSFCSSVFPKLVPGTQRTLRAEEISDLVSMTEWSRSQIEQELNRRSWKGQQELLEHLMLITWQVPHLSSETIPKRFQPSKRDLLERYPKLAGMSPDKTEVWERASRSLLKERLWKLSKNVATLIGQRASSNEQRQIFSSLLDHLDHFDQSWYHQAKIDSMIELAAGMQTQQISERIQQENRGAFNSVHQGEETYSFAGPELLLTPYSEIFNLFRAVGLKPGDTVVDLGAGFGRVGLALATKYPDVTVTGYEIVKDRIAEGARIAKAWGLEHQVHLHEQNLADPKFKPQAADVYYAFNPVSGATFDKILEDLRQVGLKSGKRFKFIVFGPSPFFKTEAQPWLKEMKGPGIPEGEELRIYEFIPEKASHTVIVDPGRITNPYQLNPIAEVRPYPQSQALLPSALNLLQQQSQEHHASFLSPSYLAAWSAGWPLEISRTGHQLLISSKKTDVAGKESFIEPLGGTPEEKAAVIRKVLADKKEQGIQAEFSFLSEPVHKLLQSDSNIVTGENPEYFDFVYPAENLASLSKTKKLRDRAHQAHAFRELHPEATLEFFDPTKHDQAQAFQKTAQGFLDRWLIERKQAASSNEYEASLLEAEGKAAAVLAETLKGPHQIQVALWANQSAQGRSVIAYASGEIRKNAQGERTLIIYVQKSDGTKNAIPFINQELVKRVVQHPELYGKVDYVNMMDASTPGLKQFKMQYEPERSLGKTYSAVAK